MNHDNVEQRLQQMKRTVVGFMSVMLYEVVRLWPMHLLEVQYCMKWLYENRNKNLTAMGWCSENIVGSRRIIHNID